MKDILAPKHAGMTFIHTGKQLIWILRSLKNMSVMSSRLLSKCGSERNYRGRWGGGGNLPSAEFCILTCVQAEARTHSDERLCSRVCGLNHSTRRIDKPGRVERWCCVTFSAGTSYLFGQQYGKGRCNAVKWSPQKRDYYDP